MFPLIRSTGSKKQSKLAAHAPFSYRLTAPISIPSNNSSQDSNRSYAKRRRALLSSFGEQSPLFSKGFPKKNAKLISQTRATPNLIEKCSSVGRRLRRCASEGRLGLHKRDMRRPAQVRPGCSRRKGDQPQAHGLAAQSACPRHCRRRRWSSPC